MLTDVLGKPRAKLSAAIIPNVYFRYFVLLVGGIQCFILIAFNVMKWNASTYFLIYTNNTNFEGNVFEIMCPNMTSMSNPHCVNSIHIFMISQVKVKQGWVADIKHNLGPFLYAKGYPLYKDMMVVWRHYAGQRQFFYMERPLAQ